MKADPQMSNSSKTGTYLIKDLDGLSREPNREKYFIVQYTLEEVIFIVRLEWGHAGEHFIKKDAKGPPVYRRAVVLF